MENGDNSLNALLEELKITEKEPKAVLKRLQSFSSEEILKATLAAEAVSDLDTGYCTKVYSYSVNSISVEQLG